MGNTVKRGRNMEEQNLNKVSPEAERASIRFAEKFSTYPIEEQIAFGVVAANILNGCSWGFSVGKNPEILENLSRFNESKVVSAVVVENGYLISISWDWVMNLLRTIGSGVFTAKDLKIANDFRAKSLVDLDRRLKRGYSGKLGILCVNDSESITVSGKRYPAYSVSLLDLVSICIKNNYNIQVGNFVKTPSEIAKYSNAVISKLQVAPSGNALFINIVQKRA